MHGQMFEAVAYHPTRWLLTSNLNFWTLCMGACSRRLLTTRQDGFQPGRHDKRVLMGWCPLRLSANMTRFLRLWNSAQGRSFNFRCPCKILIRIQLIATNLSWLVYFASLVEDRYYLYHNAISREFQSRHESGAFVGINIFSFWTLACQTKVISYAVSVTKWFYRQI